jgi:hypothetical protein
VPARLRATHGGLDRLDAPCPSFAARGRPRATRRPSPRYSSRGLRPVALRISRVGSAQLRCWRVLLTTRHQNGHVQNGHAKGRTHFDLVLNRELTATDACGYSTLGESSRALLVLFDGG